MIHFFILDKLGCAYIKQGDRVICDVAPGKAGSHVVCVIGVQFESSGP